MGTPLLIHQPSYSMLNRWIEAELLDVLGDQGIGCIVFSPLAQGLLTDRYLGGVPRALGASQESSLSRGMLTEQNLAKVRALADIAQRRGQSLAQLALAWTMRDSRVTSTLIGASSVTQLEDNVAALHRRDFSPEELDEIDRYATESDINIWARSSSDEVVDHRSTPSSCSGRHRSGMTRRSSALARAASRMRRTSTASCASTGGASSLRSAASTDG